ncbi:MAG: sterol desaturase family protein [Crocinitomicaceae bacterium]
MLLAIQVLRRLFVFNLFRYAFFAVLGYFIWYILFKKKWQFKKIQSVFPKGSDYRREIGYSLVTVILFSIIGYAVVSEPISNFTLRYTEFSDRTVGYWWLSILLMILLHDTYFYWAHRLMHHKKIFNLFHLVHHRSLNPSPWAAYAFHPLEGIIEAGVIFPIVFLIPHHVSAIIVFLFFMIIYNVYGHLGYELYPKGFNKNFIGKWLNTSVNHNQHHEKITGNYGLYFLFWDRWMGTMRDDYDQKFEEIDAKRFKHLKN